MKTRFFIIIGITATIILSFFIYASSEPQRRCHSWDGEWEGGACIISSEVIKSGELLCDPGGVILKDSYCYKEGIKIQIEQEPDTQNHVSKNEEQWTATYSPVRLKDCNSIIGNPNGTCFVESYKNCIPTEIAKKMNTIEGDPVFYSARIMKTNDSTCNMELFIDSTQDRFSSQDILHKVCNAVEIQEHDLSFTNCGDEYEYGFPLR